MQIEHEPSALQRSFWIIIATDLLIIEVNAISRDRLENQGEQEYARAVDQTRFVKTAKSLQQAISEEERQTEEQQAEFSQTLNRIRIVENTETGGQTFCYLSFAEAFGGKSFYVTAHKVGSFPLRT